MQEKGEMGVLGGGKEIGVDMTKVHCIRVRNCQIMNKNIFKGIWIFDDAVQL